MEPLVLSLAPNGRIIIIDVEAEYVGEARVLHAEPPDNPPALDTARKGEDEGAALRHGISGSYMADPVGLVGVAHAEVEVAAIAVNLHGFECAWHLLPRPDAPVFKRIRR